MGNSVFKDRLCASWDIHVNCNYRCPYCFYEEEWEEHKKRNLFLPAQEWIKYWNKIYQEYGCCHIDISGGEPFIYPSFLELISELSKVHSLGIVTNLSWEVGPFIDRISPARVKLHPSFHPYCTGTDSFIEKLIILKKNGFETSATCVGYPPILKNIVKHKDEFESKGLHISLLPFVGVYQGINYPHGYTVQEKELIDTILNTPSARGYTMERKSPKGKLCGTGYKYFRIRPEGSVYRCANSKTIGNITDENFKLFDKPMPCELDNCSCLNELVYLIENI